MTDYRISGSFANLDRFARHMLTEASSNGRSRTKLHADKNVRAYMATEPVGNGKPHMKLRADTQVGYILTSDIVLDDVSIAGLEQAYNIRLQQIEKK